MEAKELRPRTIEFVAPSGHSYELREQNGNDDDVLSNPQRAKTLHNLSDFISEIVVNNSRNKGKLTADQVHALPANDRYAILLNSRIFSLGDSVDFTFDWGKDNGGEIEYEQGLAEFLFDYSSVPTEEELKLKDKAVPFYPEPGKEKEIPVELTSGKLVCFDLLTGEGESYLINQDVRTKNDELRARNLKLMVDGKFEKVESFHLFNVNDMKQIRRKVAMLDPVFTGSTKVMHPVKENLASYINIVAIPDFFYPGEM